MSQYKIRHREEYQSVPVAVGPKAWVYGSSFPEIAVSIPAGSKKFCLFSVLCVVKVSVTGRPLIQRNSKECMCVTECGQA